MVSRVFSVNRFLISIGLCCCSCNTAPSLKAGLWDKEHETTAQSVMFKPEVARGHIGPSCASSHLNIDRKVGRLYWVLFRGESTTQQGKSEISLLGSGGAVLTFLDPLGGELFQWTLAGDGATEKDLLPEGIQQVLMTNPTLRGILLQILSEETLCPVVSRAESVVEVLSNCWRQTWKKQFDSFTVCFNDLSRLRGELAFSKDKTIVVDMSDRRDSQYWVANISSPDFALKLKRLE